MRGLAEIVVACGLALGLAACATSAPSETGGGVGSPATLEPGQEIPCNVDSECRGGVCRMGTCTGMRAPAAASAAQPCHFDSQCPRGACRAGVCVSSRANESSCTFDADCPGGACRNGSCSGAGPIRP